MVKLLAILSCVLLLTSSAYALNKRVVVIAKGSVRTCLNTPLLQDTAQVFSTLGINLSFRVRRKNPNKPRRYTHELKQPDDYISGESYSICSPPGKRYSWSHCHIDAYQASLTALVHELGHAFGAHDLRYVDNAGIMNYQNYGSTYWNAISASEIYQCMR